MKQKILKLIKNLEKFKSEDIITLTELSEDIVNKYLEEQLAEDKICKIANYEYAYLPEIIEKADTKTGETSGIYKKPIYKIDLKKERIEDIKPEELFPKKDEVKFFNETKDYNKRNIVKILTVF